MLLLLLIALVPINSAAIKEFNDRAQRYADLHNHVESALPPIDKKKESDPAVIVEHQKALAKGIHAERPKAAEGDLFTPEVQKELRSIIAVQLKSPKGPTERRMILGEGNPKNPESAAPVDLRVNAEYPARAPLSTVPPSILMTLPKLPALLEYRFVGHDLILFDAKANLIVDILRKAIR